eukprot:m.1316970 g.1316970  ORF g.1316970 m.1316970 type:complete len:566 (-) comp24840_c0_seq4:3728-5425(-)
MSSTAKAPGATQEHIKLAPAKTSDKRKGKSSRKKKAKEYSGAESIRKYRRMRPQGVPLKNVKDKKLKANLKRYDGKAQKAAYEAARAEILLPEEAGVLEAEGMERTYKFTQSEIKSAVDIAASRKVLDLMFDSGPYALRFSQNGRHCLFGGEKGHVGAFDWKSGSFACEVNFAETIRDVTWFHNETMFAVAQKKYVYVYDNMGTELYVLRKHIDPNCLEFLPYHFLLASVGQGGWLKYHDTSTGSLVAEHRTKLGPCRVMRQNPYNAVMHLGHTNGTVTLWTPNMSDYVVKTLCHRGPVQGIAIDQGGYYMATSGLDSRLKIWDIRNFKDKPVNEYFTYTPATCLDFSQRGLLAVTYGPHVQVWKSICKKAKQESPYMSHMIPGSTIKQCRFAPFEDVLGLGHTGGFSSILVPGAGEPNFDALEANPYQTKKQRQESEVKRLLEKIPSDLITLRPEEILLMHGDGRDKPSANIPQVTVRRRRGVSSSSDKDDTDDGREKKRARGRSSAKRRFLRKQQNVVDQQREDMQRKLDKDKAKRAREAQKNSEDTPRRRTALDRFMRNDED